MIDGQGKRRGIGKIGIDDILNRQTPLNGQSPLCNLLAYVTGTDTP